MILGAVGAAVKTEYTGVRWNMHGKGSSAKKRRQICNSKVKISRSRSQDRDRTHLPHHRQLVLVPQVQQRQRVQRFGEVPSGVLPGVRLSRFYLGGGFRWVGSCMVVAGASDGGGACRSSGAALTSGMGAVRPVSSLSPFAPGKQRELAQLKLSSLKPPSNPTRPDATQPQPTAATHLKHPQQRTDIHRQLPRSPHAERRLRRQPVEQLAVERGGCGAQSLPEAVAVQLL